MGWSGWLHERFQVCWAGVPGRERTTAVGELGGLVGWLLAFADGQWGWAALRVTLRNSEPQAATPVESLLWSPSWPQSRTFCMLRISLSSHPLSLVGERGWRTGHMYCNHFLSHLLEKPLQDSGFVYFPEASWSWTLLRRGETCSSRWEMSSRDQEGFFRARWGLLLPVFSRLGKLLQQPDALSSSSGSPLSASQLLRTWRGKEGV